MKRSFQGIHRPLLPAMLTIDAGQPQPSAAPTPSQPVPTPTPSHQLEEFEDSDDDDLAKSDHEEAERSKRLAGKELSNPFIADDLLKIIWLSMYHGLTNLNIGYQDWSAMKTSCCQDLKT
ncbi:hypothetical protein Tco_1536744 [Tanacetum coccineum]